MFPTRVHLKYEDTDGLKVNHWKKVSHANNKHEKAGRSDNKIDFKPRCITRNKEGNFIIIKRTIHQKDITITNVHVLNNSLKRHEARLRE